MSAEELPDVHPWYAATIIVMVFSSLALAFIITEDPELTLLTTIFFMVLYSLTHQ